jgi:hypothetical protein
VTAGPQPAGQGDGAASPAVVDEAVAAADGTRAAARWIASALGAIPSLAVLASIVRAPGGSGFDPTKLAVGVGLAALGAVIGVLGFAWVLVPVPLQDSDIRNLDLKRIPGQPYTTFDELDKQLQELRQAATAEEYQATQALADAQRAEAQAQRDDAAATAAEAKAAAAPADNDFKSGAEQARARADRAKAEAAAQTAEAAADADALSTWTAQISRRDAIRRDAYRLKAADVVRSRFARACLAAVVSVGLIAAGVVLLGLAPNPPAATAPALPRLVTLTLSSAGRQALHCPAQSLQALQTGGNASAPTVITLPAPGCPSRTIVFTTVPPRPLGTVSVPQPMSGG